MARENIDQQSAPATEQKLGTIFLSEADASREMMQERWRIWRKTQEAERMEQLAILHKTFVDKGDESTLKVLRETSAIPRILRLEQWRLQQIHPIQLLIYGMTDAYASFDSPLWRGELAPESMRVATPEETTAYGPDSTATMREGEQHSKPTELKNGEQLVAGDAESKAMLNFIGHYLESERDAPDAAVEFHRELRHHDNHVERAELALEAVFTMHEIARDFSKMLLNAEQALDEEQRQKCAGVAEELLMEFNLQRYGLYALMKNSHWKDPERYAQEDKNFVQELSRGLLIRAVATTSYDLPTIRGLRAEDYQSDTAVTVESYFAAAYEQIAHVLGIRPHRDRVMEVPAEVPKGRVVH